MLQYCIRLALHIDGLAHADSVGHALVAYLLERDSLASSWNSPCSRCALPVHCIPSSGSSNACLGPFSLSFDDFETKSWFVVRSMTVYARFQCVVDESNTDCNGIPFPIPMFAVACRFDGIVSLSMQLLVWEDEEKRRKRQEERTKKNISYGKMKQANGHELLHSGSRKWYCACISVKILTITSILVP